MLGSGIGFELRLLPRGDGNAVLGVSAISLIADGVKSASVTLTRSTTATYWDAPTVNNFIVEGVKSGDVTLTRSTAATYWNQPATNNFIVDGVKSGDVTLTRSTTATYWSS